MTIKSHPVAEPFEQRQLTLIAGPCVIESYDLCREVAERVQRPVSKEVLATSSKPLSIRRTALRFTLIEDQD